MLTLMNEAMKLERSELLGAAPGERSDERLGLRERLQGQDVAQPRGRAGPADSADSTLPGGDPIALDPKSLERGLRSERALKLAIAEMYVKGVPTRRVTEITRELCGLEVTSSDVSRAAAELDGQLTAWRERPSAAVLTRCSTRATRRSATVAR